MNFIVSKLNRDFTLLLVACDEDEQKFLESHIGEVVELSSRPTQRAADGWESGQKEKSLPTDVDRLFDWCAVTTRR